MFILTSWLHCDIIKIVNNDQGLLSGSDTLSTVGSSAYLIPCEGGTIVPLLWKGSWGWEKLISLSDFK